MTMVSKAEEGFENVRGGEQGQIEEGENHLGERSPDPSRKGRRAWFQAPKTVAEPQRTLLPDPHYLPFPEDSHERHLAPSGNLPPRTTPLSSLSFILFLFSLLPSLLQASSL